MAYNLESLVKILEQILQPDHRISCILDPCMKSEIESLLEKLLFLEQFFEKFSPVTSDTMESLESRIRDAAHEVEDILESHLANQIHSVHEVESFTISPQGLQSLIAEFDSVMEDIKKIMDGSQQSSNDSSPAVSLMVDPNPKTILVGIGEDSVQLKDRLTGQGSKLEIIPIVGMGGIGKTTLARNVYDDPYVISYFYLRAWIMISQHKRKDENSLKSILLGLLGCVIGEELTNEILQEKNDELALHLYKSLKGRRYLIVLDDMWETDDWDDIKMFFPDDKNGSRIIVTTRETCVANYAGANSSHHQMHLLNKDESWDLLRQKVFVQETCPPELEEIGKKIAENCKGLPLAVHVIGGVLSQGNRTQESWSQVAKDVSSTVATKDEQFSKILSLSYNHLPCHLKPCFLYMGAFPEYYEIRGSRLIRLWVAEGFLKPIPEKSLEEAADMYLKALVDRNLIFVREKDTNGIVKSYGIHDLLRDLCVRKASQEKFLQVNNWLVPELPDETVCLRRVSAHSPHDQSRDIYGSTELMAHARSILLTGSASREILSPAILGSRLLHVLDIMGIEFHHFPEEMLQLINLRYLAFKSRTPLPSSVSSLRNLQTIIFKATQYASSSQTIRKILHSPRLRHIKLKKLFFFSELPDGECFVLQENLQSLSTVEIDIGFVQLLTSIPNLRKLGVFFSFSLSFDVDLSCLLKLERFKCTCRWSSQSYPSSFFFIFPPSLKKVTLNYYKIQPEYLSKIGNLPNLEVLKLRGHAFGSTKWEPSEGEFRQLQFLLLEKSNLVNWAADETSFPRLQRLVIRFCSKLEEIPISIGDISTLEIIEVHKSSTRAIDSARKIQEEQLELGNDGLQVRIIR